MRQRETTTGFTGRTETDSLNGRLIRHHRFAALGGGEILMDDLTGLLGLSIPILAIILGIGVAFWAIYWEHRTSQLQYEERRLMIEKGMEPPPALLEHKKKVTPEDCLRRGTIMVFLGIGFGITYWVLRTSGADIPPDWLAGGAAAIVGLLGLGNLTYYFISTRRKPNIVAGGLGKV